jgi:hypothetical protein
MKTCTHCKEAKPFEDFYACKHTKDGRQSWCKACVKALSKEVAKSRKKVKESV